NTISTFRKLLGNSVFMGYAFSQGLMMAAMFAYISGSSFVLQELYGVTPRGYSLVFGLNGAGIILASQIAGRLAGKVPARRLLAIGLSIAAAGAVVLMSAVAFELGLPAVIPG